MKKSINLIFSDVGLSLITTVLVGFCFHFVTDDYSYVMSCLLGKQYSDFIYTDLHFQGFIVIREVYALLFHFFPFVDWHFASFILFGIFSTTIFLRAVRQIVSQKLSVWQTRGILILCALSFIENLSYISHTRVSMMFCGIALFNFAFTKPLTTRSLLLNTMLFIFGLLVRPESALGMFLLVSAAFLIYNFKMYEYMKRFGLPALVIGVFLSVFYYDLQTTDVFVRKVEPEIEYKLMANRVVDISAMKTAKDSVKYEAAKEGMWFDPKEVSPEFMRSILLPGSDLSVAHATNVFKHVAKFYTYYIFPITVTVTLLLLSLLLITDWQKTVLQLLLLYVVTFLIIYVLDYNGFLVDNRHFLSMILVSLLIAIYYFCNSETHSASIAKKLVTSVPLLSVVISVVIVVERYKEESCEQFFMVENMEKIMAAIEKKYQNRVVIISLDSRFLMDRPFALQYKPYTKNKYLLYDFFEYGTTPRYVDYLSRTCDCDGSNPVEVFKWMEASSVLYTSSSAKFNLMERYMQNVYDLPLKFVEPVSVNGLGKINEYNTKDCQIRKVDLTWQNCSEKF